MPLEFIIITVIIVIITDITATIFIEIRTKVIISTTFTIVIVKLFITCNLASRFKAKRPVFEIRQSHCSS